MRSVLAGVSYYEKKIHWLQRILSILLNLICVYGTYIVLIIIINIRFVKLG